MLIKSKISLLIFSMVFFFNFTSALEIVGEPTIMVNKTVGEDFLISFELKNELPFTFYDINFETNNLVTMNPISSLGPGEIVNVTVTINSNQNEDTDIRLRGFYDAPTGTPQDTHVVEINSDVSRLSQCDMTIIKEDTVRWDNLIQQDIILKDVETPHQFEQTIEVDSNFQRTFSTPQTFIYSPWRLGSEYHTPCTITVVNDIGKINDPQKDALLNFKISVEFDPTNLSANILQQDHDIEFFTSQEGLMSITNTGDKVAKLIHLEGDWFSFSENDFDLAPGSTNSLSYTIRPVINSTGQTGKDYTKSIIISGNFQTITKEFDIFIKHANIEEGQGSILGMSLSEFLSGLVQACLTFPNNERCKQSKEKVFIYLNASEQDFNITWNQDKVQKLEDFTIDSILDNLDQYEEILTRITLLENQTGESLNDSRSIANSVNEIEKEIKRRNNVSVFLIVMLFGLIAIGGLLYILFYHYKNRREEGMRDWRP